MEEKKILAFYDAFVSIINEYTCDKLFGQLVNAMICGHELESDGECQPELYEYILTLETLTIAECNKSANSSNFYPFSIVDKEYYESVLMTYTIEDIINYRRSLFLAKLADDLENKPDSYMSTLINNFYPSYVEVFRKWLEIKRILRKGWINRHVENDKIESDAMHSIQMLALASVCLHVYGLDSLDRQKIYEMIIIHEVAEGIVDDIVEGTEEHKTKSERERAAVHQIFATFKNRDYFINLWEEFESKSSEEARFVYELDKIDPVLKARFLDKTLNREDLYDDFYDFEDKRGTFIGTKLQKLFYSQMP